MDTQITPDKKAAELHDKFYKLIPTRIMHYEQHAKLADKLAIACIDEIMNTAKLHYHEYEYWGEVVRHLEEREQ